MISERDKKYADELEAMPRHFSHLHNRNAEVRVDGCWRISVSGEDAVAFCGATSLRDFLGKHCSLNLEIVTGRSNRDKEIRIRWNGTTGEGFRIVADSGVIEVVGDSPAGALYGAHRLQWMMGANGGGCVDRGDVKVQPRAAARITSTHFRQGFDDGEDPLTYTDAYLDLMAHYGYNGLHFYIDLYDYVVSLPYAHELDNPSAADRLAKLAELAKRATRYNIGIYLHVNATKRRADEPIFRRHPGLKGAQSWDEGAHCFCSSHPMTPQIYGDVIVQISEQVHSLKGVLAIIGGECLLHCYTRPYPRTVNGTNCEICAAHEPSEVVAGLVNSMAERVWQVRPDIRFIIWPYSAHRWSESPQQKELIALLDQRITFMTCYEKDAWIEVDGAKTSIFDYSISYVGPSEKYVTQRDLCRQRNLDFFIKTESSVALEMLNIPYIPAMENWRNRWNGMLCDRPTGILANWKFVGLTGTLSEEVAYRETWKTASDADTLAEIAARLAGEAGRSDCLAAWRCFSESFSNLAFCPGLSGFTYFRGPMYLGPAHPLILLSEEGNRLPDEFFRVDATYTELYSGDEGKSVIASVPRQPLFFDDYRWTLPLGIERMCQSLETVCGHWDKGLTHYQSALQKAPDPLRPALEREIDVALMAAVVLKSTLYLARFQMARGRVMNGPVSDSESEQSYRLISRIVTEDLRNSEMGLRLAEKDYRFGYGFVYGQAFDAQMIRAKMDFTRRVLQPDIDEFFDVLIAHAFARPFVPHERDA